MYPYSTTLDWFSRLRLCAFFAQIIVLFAAVVVLHVGVPWLSVLAILGLIPLSQFFSSFPAFSKVSEEIRVGGFLVFDTILLTIILALSGGPSNPFTLIYLVHVVISAVMLKQHWTWLISVLSILGYLSLFLISYPIPGLDNHGGHSALNIHLFSMLSAYIIVASLVAYFLSKIISGVKYNEARLQRLEEIAANQKRLTLLTTRAAGAAHELGTPLGTIAIVTHELQRRYAQQRGVEDLQADLDLLVGEVTRCKDILRRLSEESGDLAGETPVIMSLRKIVQDALVGIPQAHSACRVEIDDNLILQAIPQRSLTGALHSLIQNACEAETPDGNNVQVIIQSRRLANQTIEIRIRDNGHPLPSEILERIGEPFFSTKPPGKGMGLGVYLAKLTFEQLKGTLQFFQLTGGGIEVVVHIPETLDARSLAYGC
jgi:two-component system, sensor histidine kinase RegB